MGKEKEAADKADADQKAVDDEAAANKKQEDDDAAAKAKADDEDQAAADARDKKNKEEEDAADKKAQEEHDAATKAIEDKKAADDKATEEKLKHIDATEDAAVADADAQHECATDGSECMVKDSNPPVCKKIGANGPYLNEADFVTCTDTKQTEGTADDWTKQDTSYGKAWSGDTYGDNMAKDAGYDESGVNTATKRATKAGDDWDSANIKTEDNHDENGHHKGFETIDTSNMGHN